MPRRARGKYIVYGDYPPPDALLALPPPPPPHKIFIIQPITMYCKIGKEPKHAGQWCFVCIIIYGPDRFLMTIMQIVQRVHNIHARGELFLGQYHAGSAVNPLMS